MSDRLKTVFSMYDEEIGQNLSKPSHQKSNAMVKKHVDQHNRARNLEARNERIETGEKLAKTRTAVKGNNEITINGKQKDIVQWEM